MNNKIPFSATEMFNGHCFHCFQEGYRAGKREAKKHGHWKFYSGKKCYIICSECRKKYYCEKQEMPNYCPNCGAKMIEENQ